MDASRFRRPAYWRERLFRERFSLWDFVMLGEGLDQLFAKHWGEGIALLVIWILVAAWVDTRWRKA